MSKECYLCESKNIKQKKGTVRDNKDLRVLECSSCGLVFLSSFDHIQQNFYSESHQHDDPLEYRTPIEYDQDDERRFEYCRLWIENKRHLDLGSGEGGFVSKTQSITRTSHSFELEKRPRERLIEKGIKTYANFEEMDSSQKYDIITIFHILEHVPDPIPLLKKIKSYLAKDGRIIIEIPNSKDALFSFYENEGFSNFYWSCHLFFFDVNTLETLLTKAELKINYIQQVQRYPLSNHLYWLSKNRPGGHIFWNFLDSETLSSEYQNRLASLGICDTLIASISLS